MPAPSTLPPSFPSLDRLTVLMVEDDGLLRHGLRETLRLWGIRVIAAADGEEAKAVLRRQLVDLVITDWMMAPTGGAALVRWVRTSPDSLRPATPILVLTGNTDLGTVRTAWDTGVTAVLAKPIAPAELLRRIETALNRPTRSALPALVQTADEPDRGAERQRLVRALDRLEAEMARPRRDLLRLTSAILEVERTARGLPGVADIAASLSACLNGVGAGAQGFLDAIDAHLAALRWALANAADGTATAPGLPARDSLVACLRATVRALSARPGASVPPTQ
ncbi:DNA-binding response OmpR family regulator [Azospirillum fermentarium]|uniref:response regulator n=1 Tax=Azospirillum fermentarium TaxID=1233114 RepID=UPI0022264D03|nr:response regulator [Azospirillum fermentarium]MCW2248255.1 DNA-binding response OmpR family regulator [Azospirillum fermentarium]